MKTPSLPKLPKLPHPHKNLGSYLKVPKGGEIVTEHHRGAGGKVKP